MGVEDPKKRKRSREELITSILVSARNGAAKTKIMYSAFLNFDRLQKYLGLALEADLITFENGSYFTTEKGFEFVRNFMDLQEVESMLFEKQRALNDLLGRKKVPAR